MEQKLSAKSVLVIDYENSDENYYSSIPNNQNNQNLFNFLIVSEYAQAFDLLNSKWAPIVIVCNIDIATDSNSGLSFISEMKANEFWASIPIIALSKFSQASIILETLKRGAVDYIQHPCDPRHLFKRIIRAGNINQHQDIGHQIQHENTSSYSKILRNLYVKTMKYAILYWEISTELSKIELAENSGLWSVYLDKNGTFRTRTMDRYLKETTLPKNPKVKQIILTANFVLNQCKKQSIIQQRLLQYFYQLLESEGIDLSDSLFLKK